MPSTKHGNFTVDNVYVNLYSPGGPGVQRFGVRYFWLSLVNAQLKEAMLRKSALYETLSKHVKREDIKNYLDGQKIRYDEDNYGVEIAEKTISPGHAMASVSSSNGEDRYTTSFPFVLEGTPLHNMLKRSYYCNCDAGKRKPRDVDILFCEHEARAVIKSHIDYSSWDIGFTSKKMLRNTANLVKKVNGEPVVPIRSEIYESYIPQKKNANRIVKEEFSRVVNRKF